MNLKSFIIKNIIAPHGITDLSHSLQNNLYPKLLTLNLVTFGSSEIISNIFNANYLVDILFFASTVFHFRNDFKMIKINELEIPPIVSSSLFVSFCTFFDKIAFLELGSDILVIFMTLIHVPNHYKNSEKIINKDPLLFFIIMMFTLSFINSVTTLHPNLIINNDFGNLIKSIIVTHIIYSEDIEK